MQSLPAAQALAEHLVCLKVLVCFEAQSLLLPSFLWFWLALFC